MSLGARAQVRGLAEPSAKPLESLYLRVTNQFADACFFKPMEPKVPDLSFSLAPMLLQEVTTNNQALLQHKWFGLLTRSNGVLMVDTSRPAIYVAAGTLQHNDKSYPQLSYLWVYPDFRLQGVRITLDAAGQPCLWEVLNDSSGTSLFYVSRAVETAAQAQFGKPLPGRHHATERSWSESPKTVVARVLEDSPAVMGPMAYLQAGTSDVTTLICRCMPAQVKHLACTKVYELVPVSGAAEDLLNEARNLSHHHPVFWPGEVQEGTRLEKALRLPKSL